ncbi:MAG: ribose 1,5-bisphosphokinase [Pseudomonadota bacterium]
MGTEATLFYLVGASGSGKDSLLQACQADIAEHSLPLVVAHRYITRDWQADNNNENFISLTPQDYKLRKQQGLFALSWQANGCDYAVGVELKHWLDAGLSVIVNGSRAYLPMAKALFPKTLISIEVSVADDVLQQRLALRNRESEEQIKQRLDRHSRLHFSCQTDTSIDNSGEFLVAYEQLKNIISQRV